MRRPPRTVSPRFRPGCQPECVLAAALGGLSGPEILALYPHKSPFSRMIPLDIVSGLVLNSDYNHGKPTRKKLRLDQLEQRIAHHDEMFRRHVPKRVLADIDLDYI